MNPPFQTRSAPKDPANSFASTSHSLQTPLPHPISTEATLPPCPKLQQPLLAVDTLAPTLPSTSQTTQRCALTSSLSHAPPPSPPAIAFAGFGRSTPAPLSDRDQGPLG